MLKASDFLVDQDVRRKPDAPTSPLVSVIMPTAARFRDGSLERATRSVLTQSASNLELIIVDDGSRDGTADFIARIQQEDSRVIHVRHEMRSWLPAVRCNEGIALSRGEYIAFQFDDDYWRTNALEDLLAAADGLNAIVAGRSELSFEDRPPVTIPADPLSTIRRYNVIANNAVLIPRRVLESSGLYDPHVGLRRCVDWDLWLRAEKYAEIKAIDATVSEVFAGRHDAIGAIAAADYVIARCFQSVPRDEALSISNWVDARVSSLDAHGVDLPTPIRDRLYERCVVPYSLGVRHNFPELGGLPRDLRDPTNLRVIISDYTASVELGIEPYAGVAGRRHTVSQRLSYIEQGAAEVTEDRTTDLYVRPLMHDPDARIIASNGQGRATAAYLDDDLLNLYKVGPEFDYCAPGTPLHDALRSTLVAADAVWSTSTAIDESVRPLNPRIVPHNGAIDPACLPGDDELLRGEGPIVIGVAAGAYKSSDLAAIWDAFVRISDRHRESIRFEFMGVKIDGLPELRSPVRQIPFDPGYTRYLATLRSAGWEIFACPLLDDPPPKRAKAVSKFYQAAVAGALPIFSDVLAYSQLTDGIGCLKVKNTVEDWERALESAISMPSRERNRMRRDAVELARSEFAPAVQIDLHEAACAATNFHARTRDDRGGTGRPHVAVIADGHVDRRIVDAVRSTLRTYGAETVDRIDGAPRPVIAHTIGLTPDVWDEASVAGIPVVLHLVEANFAELEGVPSRSAGLFELYSTAQTAINEQPFVSTAVVRATLDAETWRDGRDRNIQRAYGSPSIFTIDVDYDGLRKEVSKRGVDLGGEAASLSTADIAVVRDPDRQIRSIVEAMASGAIVVAAPSPASLELLSDLHTGVVCRSGGTEDLADGVRTILQFDPVVRTGIASAARAAARTEATVARSAATILNTYLCLLDAPVRSFTGSMPESSEVELSVGEDPSDAWSLSRPWSGTVVPRRSRWTGIRIDVGTPSANTFRTDLRLTIRTAKGHAVREVVEPVTVRGEVGSVTFAFDVIVNSAGHTFEATIEATNGAGAALSLREPHRPPGADTGPHPSPHLTLIHLR